MVSPSALYSGADTQGLRNAAIGYVSRLREEIRAGAPLYNRATGWDWVISREDQNKLARDYARTAVDLRVAANLRDLTRVAILGESHGDYNKSPQIRAAHRFYSPVLLGGKLFRVKLTVMNKVSGGKNLHCLESVEVESPAVITPLLESLGAHLSERKPAELMVTIADLFEGAKNCCLIFDHICL